MTAFQLMQLGDQSVKISITVMKLILTDNEININ